MGLQRSGHLPLCSNLLELHLQLCEFLLMREHVQCCQALQKEHNRVRSVRLLQELDQRCAGDS